MFTVESGSAPNHPLGYSDKSWHWQINFTDFWVSPDTLVHAGGHRGSVMTWPWPLRPPAGAHSSVAGKTPDWIYLSLMGPCHPAAWRPLQPKPQINPTWVFIPPAGPQHQNSRSVKLYINNMLNFSSVAILFLYFQRGFCKLSKYIQYQDWFS